MVEVVAETVEEEAVEEAAAEPEEAEPKEADPKARTAGDPATQTSPHKKPVTSIGDLGRGRGIVPTDTPVHGETTRARNQDTIEILLQLKSKQ